MTFPLSDSLRIWAHINDFFLIVGAVGVFFYLVLMVVCISSKRVDSLLGGRFWSVGIVLAALALIGGALSGVIWQGEAESEQQSQLITQVEEVYGVELSEAAAERLLEGASTIDLRDGRAQGFVERFGTVEYTDEEGELVAAQLTWYETEWVLTAIDSAVELDRVN